MQGKKGNIKGNFTSAITKQSRKYIPTPQQANLILNYFLHNNFQDFNTWQQISKSRCQFQYNENKMQYFQCKVTLKWDDASMPILVQVGQSRNKKNAKKKALQKLVQNLIFLGLIGYGFKDSDFIKRLPKRRKQSSESDSEIPVLACDQNIKNMIQSKNFQVALSQITVNNFELLMGLALRQSNLTLFVLILRKLQAKKLIQQIDTTYNLQDVEEQLPLDLHDSDNFDPFEIDLTQTLHLGKLQLLQQQVVAQENSLLINSSIQMELPSVKLNNSSQGKISFQFFHPIEYNLIFRRNIQTSALEFQKRERSDYFNDYYKQCFIPNFQQQSSMIPLSLKVIIKIFQIILEFSYNYRLVINLLSIIEREITCCSVESVPEEENQKLFLKLIGSVTAEFAFMLNKKSQILTLSLEGLINLETETVLIFTPKQPEQIVSMKISRKLNTSQIQQMQQFAIQQFVLLISKIDEKQIFIGQIVECWPSIKLKCLSFETAEKEKLPFTMYKLANGKLYNRLIRSICHASKIKLSTLKSNTFLLVQKPTQPILLVIYQLLSEWVAQNQSVLIVSENFSQIFSFLYEKGFKIAKVTQKIEQRNLNKKSIICCSPSGVCADVIKNYAFTRIIMQNAQRIPEPICTLAQDKGCEKLYLIGDPLLPPGVILSQFARNRNMQKSLFQRLIKSGLEIINFKQKVQQNYFDGSILGILNKYFYNESLNKQFSFESPTIKGFPWPSETQKICFVHVPANEHQLRNQVNIASSIIVNVLKSGFIGINQVGCRVTTTSARSHITMKLYNIFKKNPELNVAPEIGSKCIDFVTGSRFKQRSLCILFGESKSLKVSMLIGGLEESRRGFIVIGDLEYLWKQQKQWRRILKLAKEKKLILIKNKQ